MTSIRRIKADLYYIPRADRLVADVTPLVFQAVKDANAHYFTLTGTAQIDKLDSVAKKSPHSPPH